MLQHDDMGFLLPDSQNVNDIYSFVSDLISQDSKNQYVCFSHINQKNYSGLGLPIIPITECRFFYGTLWVFDNQSLNVCKNFPNLRKIYYYLTDIPWEQTPNINYFDLRNLCEENSKINVIAKTSSIYNVYNNCWNKQPIGIMEKLNYENFKRLVLVP